VSAVNAGALRRGFALVLLALLLPLGGCAKKNAPTAPEGQPDTFHRQYPSE
jgi:hypothetical protein